MVVELYYVVNQLRNARPLVEEGKEANLLLAAVSRGKGAK